MDDFRLSLRLLLLLGLANTTPLVVKLKRRMGAAPSSRATGLDQIPEALLPLLVLKGIQGLTLVQIAGITFAFFVLEIPLAWVTHRIGLRDRPY